MIQPVIGSSINDRNFTKYKKIAVLQFSDANNRPSSGQLVQALAYQYFNAYEFDVLERSQLQNILNEQKLSASGLLDSSQQMRVGRLLGVDAIVTGDVSIWEDNSSGSNAGIYLRVIDVKTGQMVYACYGYFNQLMSKPVISNAQYIMNVLVRSWVEPNEIINSEFQDHVVKGSVLFQKGKYEDAIVSLNQALAINPKSAQAYGARSEIYMRLQNYRQALDDLNQSLVFNPYSYRVFIAHGRANYQIGKWQEAKSDFSRALELNPPKEIRARIHSSRGIVHARLGNIEETNNDINRSLAINAESSGEYYNFACAYAILGKTNEACNYLKKSIERGYNQWEHIKKDSDFDSLRDNACYIEIMQGR
jgi:tetratricopeptide (TPR) repeat protein